MSKIFIEIDDNNFCKLTTEKSGGARVNKYLPFEDIVSLLNASFEDVEVEQEEYTLTDILPGDSLISTIQVKEIPKYNAKWYVLLRGDKPVTMTYRSGAYNKTYKNVAMPKTLFAIKVSNCKCVNLRICVVKDNFINEKTIIYRYPYSNVFDTSKVCLGNNRINDFLLNDLSNIMLIPEMFFAMINNNDGYRDSNHSGMEYTDLLECLEEAEFDNDILKQSYNTPTYEDFIKSLK
jgi:hypothetical protein